MKDLHTVLSRLEAMMQRRHQIVHRADKARTGDDLQAIDPVEVVEWLTASLYFVLRVVKAGFKN